MRFLVGLLFFAFVFLVGPAQAQHPKPGYYPPPPKDGSWISVPVERQVVEVRVSLYGLKQGPTSIAQTTVADYLTARRKGNPDYLANWQPVATNPAVLPVGNYYFRVLARNAPSEVIGPVAVVKSGPLFLLPTR